MFGVILKGFLALQVILFNFLHTIVKSSLRLAKFEFLHKVYRDLFTEAPQLLVDRVFCYKVRIHTLCHVKEHGF